jgi:hypothetical protein
LMGDRFQEANASGTSVRQLAQQALADPLENSLPRSGGQESAIRPLRY